MTKSKLSRILAAALSLLAIGGVAAPTASAARPTNLEYAMAHHYCPAGLVCPSLKRHHPYEGPPYRIARIGDTLWGIAKRYLGSGSKWTQLCVPLAVSEDPSLLQVGEAVGFC